MDVVFTLDDGREIRSRIGGQLAARGRMIRVPYTGARPLRGVAIDPGHTLLLDDDFTNNHADIRGATRSPQNHVFALVTTLAAHAIAWLSP